MIVKIKEIWKKYELGFYASVAGSFIMGTIHLVSTIMSFSWLSFNYMLFCYLLMLARVFIWYLHYKNKSTFYLSGAIWLTLVLIPLGVSLFKTITDKEVTAFIFDWIIYGYAFYAFFKLIMSIINLSKKEKRQKPELNVISWMSLISALFTMFMLEFTMLRTYIEGDIGSMQILEFVIQITILAITLFAIGLFIYRTIGKTR